MKRILKRLGAVASLFLLLASAAPALAWELAGTRTITLHGRNGEAIPIGTVTFQPAGPRTVFTLDIDHGRFKDFFLSMKEFKCLEGPEVMCLVPYPYANPATVTPDDLRWLEHALLFLYKAPKDFGARLWNGLIFRMSLTDEGIVGSVQAVDLTLIGAPPLDTTIPPFGPGDRQDINADSRWLGRLTIR